MKFSLNLPKGCWIFFLSFPLSYSCSWRYRNMYLNFWLPVWWEFNQLFFKIFSFLFLFCFSVFSLKCLRWFKLKNFSLFIVFVDSVIYFAARVWDGDGRCEFLFLLSTKWFNFIFKHLFSFFSVSQSLRKYSMSIFSFSSVFFSRVSFFILGYG